MYATIRRYTLKDSPVSKDTFTGLKSRLEGKFAPQLNQVRGFHAYYAINANDRELVTISLFEDQSGGEESTRRAAEFVKTDPLRDQLTSPEIIEGELLVSKEAMVGAH